jgi:predicted dienelactone hydrolase
MQGGAASGMIPRRALLALAALAPLNATAAEDSWTDEVWTDAARHRSLPVRLRPPSAPGPRPVVILSHGLGGSREGLAYLGRTLAEAGFWAVHLQHPGTDSAIWQGVADRRTAFAAAALDPGQALARLQDAIFALDEITRRSEAGSGPLRGRVDLSRLAAAGHSYGAWTVQHLLGQRIPGGDRGLRLPETRLRAGIILSPIPPQGLPPRLAFARMSAPMLHVTGTEDRTFLDGASPEDRDIPFRSISNQPQALAVLLGATHAAFADEAAAGARWAEASYHARTAALAVLFLRAVVMEDTTARQAMASVLSEGDRLEVKGWE